MIVTIRSSSSEVISPALQGLAFDVHSKRACDIPFVQIDISFFANQVGVPSADTLDLGQGVHDLLLAINVGVEET
jgi:hypothetical protein